ncbi:MAG TPA: imelysin family protein [Panacibacter sp.]|nr:imelysin family protein [Panacibacter sp.]
MKKIIIPCILFSAIIYTACNKAPESTPQTDDFAALEKTVLTDFANNVALSSYLNLSINATKLNTALTNLNATTNDANLAIARQAWKDMRTVWEQSESYLFGPVEDNDYDPNMDTWPTDYVQLDSVLASTNALTVADIQSFTLSLRGYHPIEYIIFGENSSRTAAELTVRQKTYMISLSTDLTNTCNDLYLSWASAPVNFAQQVLTAGSGSIKYAKKQEVFLALADGLIGICEEVGEGKMKEPFDAQDPQIVESPYSGNSTTDFKNNITGIRNVYLGLNGGKGLKDLVAAKNKSLDNTIQSEITAAINFFDNISQPYESAIISQRVQIQQTMDALGVLKETLENELRPFIIQYIQD